MQLDGYQMAEFDQHWGSSYVKVKDRLVMVSSIHDREGRLFAGSSITKSGDAHRMATYSIDDMEPLAIPAGFYGDVNRFFMFSRSPNQGTKRGVARSNSFCLQPMYDGRNLSSTFIQLDSPYLATAFYSHYAKEKWDIKYFKDMVRHVSQHGGGFSIGKNYAGIYYRSPKRGNICSLSCHGGVIGEIHVSGEIRLAKKLEHMRDSINEELAERLNQEVVVHVQ